MGGNRGRAAAQTLQRRAHLRGGLLVGLHVNQMLDLRTAQARAAGFSPAKAAREVARSRHEASTGEIVSMCHAVGTIVLAAVSSRTFHSCPRMAGLLGRSTVWFTRRSPKLSATALVLCGTPIRLRFRVTTSVLAAAELILLHQKAARAAPAAAPPHSAGMDDLTLCPTQRAPSYTSTPEPTPGTGSEAGQCTST
eukprot:scaffold3183_cov381-Prasinococcus_capsulatus_cf.AAC.15